MMNIVFILSIGFFLSGLNPAQAALTEKIQIKNIVFYYETPSNSVDGDLSLHSSEAPIRSLAEFAQKVILPKIPSQIQKQFEALRVEVVFKDEVKTSGLFEPTASGGRITIRKALLFSPRVNRILTHEIFHAIHFSIHPNEPSWIREGLAQEFEHRVLGGYSGRSLTLAMKQSSTPLEYVFQAHEEFTERETEAMGHAFLYMHWISMNCGDDHFFWKISSQGLMSALSQSKKAHCKSFETTVVNSEIARFYNRAEFTVIPEFRVAPTVVNSGTLTQNTLEQLPSHYPLLLSSKYLRTLESFKNNPKIHIYYVLGRFPYQLTRLDQLKSESLSPHGFFMIIKN